MTGPAYDPDGLDEKIADARAALSEGFCPICSTRFEWRPGYNAMMCRNGATLDEIAEYVTEIETAFHAQSGRA